MASCPLSNGIPTSSSSRLRISSPILEGFIAIPCTPSVAWLTVPSATPAPATAATPHSSSSSTGSSIESLIVTPALSIRFFTFSASSGERSFVNSENCSGVTFLLFITSKILFATTLILFVSISGSPLVVSSGSIFC